MRFCNAFLLSFPHWQIPTIDGASKTEKTDGLLIRILAPFLFVAGISINLMQWARGLRKRLVAAVGPAKPIRQH